jgi:hypothetical protein
MEPMNATVSVTDDAVTVWAPIQGMQMTEVVLAGVLKVPPEKITIHRTYLGGGFGRRLLADFVVQAALCSKAVSRPVKLIWSREEDFKQDWFRPAFLSRSRAALGADGFARGCRASAGRLARSRRRRPFDSAALGPARSPGADRHQVRLWRGVVWGLHRACQRRGGVRVRAVDAVQGARVTTIEGLSRSGLHRLQRAGIEHQVPQCGYCQPGFIMAVAALLAKIPRPTAADIEGRSQHLPLRHLRQDQASDCRCSGRLGRSLAALP